MHKHLAFPHVRGKRVHLGVCGSVAAYKTLEILRVLLSCGVHPGATLTKAAREFITPLSFQALGAEPVYSDWFTPEASTFAHLEPGQHSDVLAIAPATANTIAKIALGLADDLLSCQALAFPGPVVLAPSMNHRMWSATATQDNWARLKERGFFCIEPETGPMACGESGSGRFPAVETIVATISRALSPQDLQDKEVLLSLGPTREHWDPVRFLSNPSSGRMGQALALAAWMRGARVHVVQGPVDIWFPSTLPVTRVESAQQMYEACLDLWPAMDIGCLVAAVSDFRPAESKPEKIKKTERTTTNKQLDLIPNPDILATLGSRKSSNQTLVGFAAETGSLPQNMEAKLRSKNLDLIAGNLVGSTDSGFVASTNEVTILDRDGHAEEWALTSKTDVAWRIWDRIKEL